MIRALQVADLASVHEVVKAIQNQVPPPAGFFWSLDEISSELQVGQGIGLFEEEQLVSFILYRILGEILEIELLASHPQRMGRGGMRSLLAELELRHENCVELWLEVHDANLRARNFYEKFGFIETGLRPRYYRDGGGARIFAKKIAKKS